MSATGVTKLTLKTMGCKPKRAAVEEKKVELATIYGKVTKTLTKFNEETGQTHTALVGVFEGVNLETGEVYQSGKLFLPAGIQELLEAPFESDNPPASLEFGMKINAIPASNAQGYSYSFQPLREPSEGDELAALRNQMKSLAALPAPAAAPVVEGEKEKEKTK